MSDIAIKVEDLSKRYRIGLEDEVHDTLAGQLTSYFRSPLQNLRNLRQLTRFDEAGQEMEDVIWALRDVSFEVERGEVVGIIGRNGAGKSTLLKILSRITHPTSGRVELDGRVSSLLEVGTGFHPELTGRENIYLNGTILGMTKAEVDRKFDEIVDFSGVEKFIDTSVKRYSSGMRVRLAFSVAAHLEPEILLVDEVLAVGDAEFQKKCLGKMGTIAGKGRTVLFVSHNMAAIEGLCPRVLLLETGKLTYDGNDQEGIAQYLASLDSADNSELIRHRIDRTGNGKARVTDIRIINELGEETNYVGMGESFYVKVQSEGRLRKAIVGIHFSDSHKRRLVRGYTWEQVVDDIELTGNDIIKCYFNEFPLMHGTYSIDIWIGQYHDCADCVENATKLTLVPRDVFGTGRTPDPKGAIAFCDVDWEINGVSIR